MKIRGYDVDWEMFGIAVCIVVGVIGLIFGDASACTVHLEINQTTTTTVAR